MVFKNPTGWWKYERKFSIEFTGERFESIVKALDQERGVKIYKNMVKIATGKVENTTGGIEFLINGKTYHWQTCLILVIRKNNGNFLWKNRLYEQMKKSSNKLKRLFNK